MKRSGFDWCVHCGRPLRDEGSRAAGLGPECAALPECRDLAEMIARIRQPLLGEGTDGGAEENH